jgi:hypothetical protein
MRFQAAHVRATGLAAAAALLAVGVSGCSGGSSKSPAVVTPNSALGAATAAATPTPSAASADPGSSLPSYDASAALVAKQQQIGCKTALGPFLSRIVDGTATQQKGLSVAPPAAKQAIQDMYTDLNSILQQDPNALLDGNAAKAGKVLDAFCATPAGVQFVGSTPGDALKPPKPVKPTTTHR